MAARVMKILTAEDERNLEDDLLVRFGLQRTMAAHSMPVLEAEFGVPEWITQRITHDDYDQVESHSVSPTVVAEIKRRRQLWFIAHEQWSVYTMKALAVKYGVCVATIRNRIAALKQRLQRDAYRADRRRVA